MLPRNGHSCLCLYLWLPKVLYNKWQSFELIVLVLSVFFIRVFSSINVPFFRRKHSTQAFSSIKFALPQILIKYLSSTANPIVGCRTNLHDTRTTTVIPKIFIHHFSNFYIVKMYIYSSHVYSTFTFIFLGYIEENKGVIFYWNTVQLKQGYCTTGTFCCQRHQHWVTWAYIDISSYKHSCDSWAVIAYGCLCYINKHPEMIDGGTHSR